MLKRAEKSISPLCLQRLDSLWSGLVDYIMFCSFIAKEKHKKINLKFSEKQKQCSSTIQALNFRSHQTKIVEPIIYIQVLIFRESLKHSIQENFISSFTSLLKNLIPIFYIYYRFSFLLL